MYFRELRILKEVFSSCLSRCNEYRLLDLNLLEDYLKSEALVSIMLRTTKAEYKT